MDKCWALGVGSTYKLVNKVNSWAAGFETVVKWDVFKNSVFNFLRKSWLPGGTG